MPTSAPISRIMANRKLKVAAKNIKDITELLQVQSAIMQKYKRRSLFNNDTTRPRAAKTQLAESTIAT